MVLIIILGEFFIIIPRMSRKSDLLRFFLKVKFGILLHEKSTQLYLKFLDFNYVVELLSSQQ